MHPNQSMSGFSRAEINQRAIESDIELVGVDHLRTLDRSTDVEPMGVEASYIKITGWGAIDDVAGLRVAIVGYAVGPITDSIWKGQRWGTTLKFVFDGVVYGLVTAGTFGWLWPGTV